MSMAETDDNNIQMPQFVALLIGVIIFAALLGYQIGRNGCAARDADRSTTNDH